MAIYLADYDKGLGGDVVHVGNEDDQSIYKHIKQYSNRVSVFYQDSDYSNDKVDFYE